MAHSIDTSDIQIHKVAQSRIQQVDFDQLIFGRNFSDHMFMADFNGEQWTDLRIVPYGKIEMQPSVSALHYGQSIFEGLKAYRSAQGEVLLFRPQANAARLNQSAHRICMAELPEEIFMEGLLRLIDIDRNWVSDRDGYSLYIRPFMFATEEYLGIKASDTYRFMIITSPVGSYYEGAIKVKVETHYSRVTAGGTGNAKVAGNYAASLYPARLGQQNGYRQLVWTDSKEHKYIEESGTMNIFVMIDGVLITPTLSTDTILSGITRDSVIQVAKYWGIPVEERLLSVEEVKQAILDNRLTEMFGAGTAATIAQIELINIHDQDYTLPAVAGRAFSNKLATFLSDLKTGKIDDPFGWIVKV